MSKPRCHTQVPVPSALPSTSANADAPFTTNWALCCLCQEIKEEKLTVPYKNPRADVNAGYNTLTRNLHDFIELDAMPILQCKSLSHLDEGPGIAMTLREHGAKYHKSCKDKVNACKLDRARERKRKYQEDPPSIAHTRAKFSAIPQKDPEICFFNCGKPLLHESHDRRAHTFKLDGMVKQYALDMECIDITNKIGTSDIVAF